MEVETTKMLEIPAYLFELIVLTAHRMLNSGSDGDPEWGESPEDIPAVKWLCDWWNKECPDLEMRRAGSFNIYVAEENDKWHELARHRIRDGEDLMRCSHLCAVPYDSINVIVEFLAYQADFLIVGEECTTILVDGNEGETIEADLSDTAWGSYLGLLAFKDIGERLQEKFYGPIDVKAARENAIRLGIPGIEPTESHCRTSIEWKQSRML
jgi:hypothetical protein